jgi:hypothetical protein
VLIGRHDVERDFGLLDEDARQICLNHAAEATWIHDISRMFDETEQARQAKRKNIGAAEAQPDALQRSRSFEVGDAGKVRGVDCAYRGADHKIRKDSPGQQDPQHADLYRTKTPAASEDKCLFLVRVTAKPSNA